MTDPVAAWSAAHERVCALVASLPAEQVEARVPACPDWKVRDLLSHVVGLGADVLAGDEPDDHHQTWTAAQVDARRDRSAAELIAEWRALAPDLVAWMREHGSRPLNDVVIHEQDLRSAVGRPGARDTDGFALVRDRMAERFGRPRPPGSRWSAGPGRGGRPPRRPGCARPTSTWAARSPRGVRPCSCAPGPRRVT